MRNVMLKVCTLVALGVFASACSEQGVGAAKSSGAPGSSAAVAPAGAREIELPEGTALAVELQTAVASNSSDVEDPVEAIVAEPVVVNGETVIPAGSIARGQVSQAKASGKVQGRASVSIRFDTLVVGRDRYPIVAGFTRTAPSEKKKDVETIAIPAAGGAIIGAIVGGKKGAAIGTAVGGGAGTAIVLATSGKEINLPPGTRLNLRLHKSVSVRLR